MNRKFIYLMGGLGNVLFQINFAYNLRDQGYDVVINHSLLKNSPLSKYILRWSFHNTLPVIIELKLLEGFEVEEKLNPFIFLALISKSIKAIFVNTEFFGLTSPSIKNLKARHLFGYFHLNNRINKNFINLIRENIQAYLNSSRGSKCRELLRILDRNLLVHVRGGDYSNQPSFYLDPEYYRTATKDFDICHIVTNDKNYANKVFSNININLNIIEGSNQLDDFIIIALSKQKILANSTFSWWAAEVGDDDSIIFQKYPFYTHVEWHPDSNVKRKWIVL